MDVSNLFLAIVLAAGAWHVAATIMIREYLRERGLSESFLLLGFRLFHYVHQYRETTFAESGRVGALFYHYVVSINVALAAAIAFALSTMA